jgi:hypothetical protein
MGDIMQGIFGGSKSKQSSQSNSHNEAYPWLQQTYGGVAQQGVDSSNMLHNLLGLGDSAAGSAAFNQYKNSSGYQADEHAGTQAITNSNAAKGLLGSGETLKDISRFGTDLTDKYYNNYLDRLMGYGNQGLQAGGLISGAGQVANSSSSGNSSQKPGIAKFLGSIMAGIPGG